MKQSKGGGKHHPLLNTFTYKNEKKTRNSIYTVERVGGRDTSFLDEIKSEKTELVETEVSGDWVLVHMT